MGRLGGKVEEDEFIPFEDLKAQWDLFDFDRAKFIQFLEIQRILVNKGFAQHSGVRKDERTTLDIMKELAISNETTWDTIQFTGIFP
ncbi:unnamed protein product [Haemonchus placei]|uniref:EF-hand domain-containing protein n=1 Tax=Haemonchus placei TaxID=6290 RepID=A0A0N4W5H6_HAEPC|nr:unnamed protein product [Haemonchus placei]